MKKRGDTDLVASMIRRDSAQGIGLTPYARIDEVRSATLPAF
jgi:hypothetical protein